MQPSTWEWNRLGAHTLNSQSPFTTSTKIFTDKKGGFCNPLSNNSDAGIMSYYPYKALAQRAASKYFFYGLVMTKEQYEET